MKTLIPAAPGSRSRFGNVAGLSAVPPTQKARSQCMRPLRARELVGKRRRIGRQRVGVRHFEDGGDAAHHRGERAGLKVLLVLRARLAEMHLAVDDARQDCEPGGVDNLARIGGREIAERGDPAGFHADVANADAVVIYDTAAAEEEIEGLGHQLSSSSLLWGRVGEG